MVSPTPSNGSTKSAPIVSTIINVDPTTSAKADEVKSLISEEDEQFTTPPAQPSPNSRFFVASVSEAPRKPSSVFGARSVKAVATAVTATRFLANGSTGTTGSSSSWNGKAMNGNGLPNSPPFSKSSIQGSIPRNLNDSNSQPQTAANFHEVSTQPYYGYNAGVGPQAHNATLGFDIPQLEPLNRHRGELALHEKYRYDLSRAQLKASSRTSALLAGFAMVALVELQYEDKTPHGLMILLGVVTTLLVSVHLLALMISTCLLPYIEANGCTQDSPHIRLSRYIELSWLFSTCIGLVLFLLEIGVIFIIKFEAINFPLGGYITTALLVPVLIAFTILSCMIHRNRFSHSMERVNDKVVDLEKYMDENEITRTETNPNILQSVNVVKP
ncbi:Protein orai [Aphelenchoides besseyi]|nr:Protein orai [Aphelenchoides besseyi]